MAKLKVKQSEIHKQIMILSEKEAKISKNEAHLMMKELKLKDMTKDIKEKQRELA